MVSVLFSRTYLISPTYIRFMLLTVCTKRHRPPKMRMLSSLMGFEKTFSSSPWPAGINQDLFHISSTAKDRLGKGHTGRQHLDTSIQPLHHPKCRLSRRLYARLIPRFSRFLRIASWSLSPLTWWPQTSIVDSARLPGELVPEDRTLTLTLN